MPHCAVGMALVSPTNVAQLPQTGGWPYIWVDWPSGVAIAGGHVTPTTSTDASRVATSLPSRHMAVIVARLSWGHRSRNRTVTFRRPGACSGVEFTVAQHGVRPAAGPSRRPGTPATMSSTHVSPWKTTVCWVPSKVSSVPPSWLARSTPA